jgi:preprotein translocase SecE subunit
MADKKKTNSQAAARSTSRMAETQARSDVKEQSKTVKASAQAKDERKVQQNKPVRRASKSSATWTSRWRTNRYIRFVLEAYYELRHKVTWPTFQEARNMTIAVILLSAAVGLLLGAVDLGLYNLFLLISHIGAAK